MTYNDLFHGVMGPDATTQEPLGFAVALILYTKGYWSAHAILRNAEAMQLHFNKKKSGAWISGFMAGATHAAMTAPQ